MGLAAGTRVGPYEIVGLLGAGGMGEVYRARDPRLGREVAIKVSRERFSERSTREARTVAGLNHARLCALYDVGPDYLVMELVEGETLAERLGRGALPVEEALTVARQLAEAMEYAHERGVIHRDLKPANIKVTPEDQVKVLDFGLAKALEADASEEAMGEAATVTSPATMAGTILGTAAYMAPEQARGKAVDRRADIWAFGVVWYEMLTSERAFAGETTSDVLAAVIRAEPDWTRLPADLPDAQRRLLQRCLRKDARQRQQSMGDVRLELEERDAGLALPGVAGARRRGWTGWAGGSAAGIVVAMLGAWWWAPRAVHGPVTTYRAITSMAGVQMYPTFSPDASSVAFVSSQDGSDNVYVTLIGGGTLLEVTHSREEKSHPAWSPNGHLLAYAQRNAAGLWDIWEVPALGGTPRLMLRDADDPAWSPDGQWLAYYRASTGALWMSTPEGENASELAPPAFDRNGDPRFSPDGSEIAFVAKTPGPDGVLDVVDRNSKAVRQLSAVGETFVTLSPAWSPDGQWIYYASSQDGAVNIWKRPAAGGAAEQVTTGQGDDAQLDVSRDGQHLVFSTFRTDSHIAQLDLGAGAGTGKDAGTLLTTDPGRNQLAPQYSPDGKRLAYFTNLKGVEMEQIWTSNADGSAAHPLVNDKHSNVFPRWSEDGRQLFFSSDAPFLGNGNEPRQSRRVASDGGTPETVLADQTDLYFDAGPGGQMLYVAPGHAIASYDAATRQPQVLWTGSAEMQPYVTRWLPDGQGFAFSVKATSDEDVHAGLWICELACKAPRQVFHGWVEDFERGGQGLLYIRAGAAELRDSLWTVGEDGRGLRQLRVTLPRVQDYSGAIGRGQFAVSPNGRMVAYALDDDLQATLGMLSFGK